MEKNTYNIVIIDDEHDILTILEKYLTRNEKLHITSFDNPLNALKSIDNTTDLVLMDIMMPQLNGILVLKELIEKNPNLKVIMMTSKSTLDKIVDAHKFGAKYYIEKPFDSLKIVEDKILEILEKPEEE